MEQVASSVPTIEYTASQPREQHVLQAIVSDEGLRFGRAGQYNPSDLDDQDLKIQEMSRHDKNFIDCVGS